MRFGIEMKARIFESSRPVIRQADQELIAVEVTWLRWLAAALKSHRNIRQEKQLESSTLKSVLRHVVKRRTGRAAFRLLQAGYSLG